MFEGLFYMNVKKSIILNKKIKNTCVKPIKNYKKYYKIIGKNALIFLKNFVEFVHILFLPIKN